MFYGSINSYKTDLADASLELKLQWHTILFTKAFSKVPLIQVDVKQYNLLLDYPDSENPNMVRILNDETVFFNSTYKEKTLHEGDDHPDFVNSFLAYSAAGTASGTYNNFIEGNQTQVLKTFEANTFFTPLPTHGSYV